MLGPSLLGAVLLFTFTSKKTVRWIGVVGAHYYQIRSTMQRSAPGVVAPMEVGGRFESVPSDGSAVADVRAALGSRTPGGYYCSWPQAELRQERNGGSGSGGEVASNGDAADTNVVVYYARRCVTSLWGAGGGVLGLVLLLLFTVPLWWSCCAASVGAGSGGAALAEGPQAIRWDPIHELDGDPTCTSFADTTGIIGGTIGGTQALGAEAYEYTDDEGQSDSPGADRGTGIGALSFVPVGHSSSGNGGANSVCASKELLRPSGTLDVTQTGTHEVVTLCVKIKRGGEGRRGVGGASEGGVGGQRLTYSKTILTVLSPPPSPPPHT